MSSSLPNTSLILLLLILLLSGHLIIMADSLIYSTDQAQAFSNIIYTFRIAELTASGACQSGWFWELSARNWLRKRGKKGGLHQCIKNQGFKPPLPNIIMWNVRSWQNKMDKLRTNVKSTERHAFYVSWRPGFILEYLMCNGFGEPSNCDWR